MLAIGFSSRKGGIAGWFSGLIRKATKSKFSHVWVRYYHPVYTSTVVIEASLLGIIEKPYSSYLKEITDVVELKPPTYFYMELGMPAIGKKLGTSYDVGSLFGRLIVSAARYIGFKIKNPLRNPNKDCCVENVIRCLQAVNNKYSDLDMEVESPQSLYERLLKDGWTIGYTPSLVVGVWVGNNNGALMKKEPGVVLAGPIWNKFIKKALIAYPSEKRFQKPEPIKTDKPILKGEVNRENPHPIFYYVDKNDPLGKPPERPESDPQYENWQAGINAWLLK